MAERSVSVSISMPVEMDEDIQREAEEHDMGYSQYVRHVIRQATDSPFECPEQVLYRDENHEKGAT
jgi:hypothetical protein